MNILIGPKGATSTGIFVTVPSPNGLVEYDTLPPSSTDALTFGDSESIVKSKTVTESITISESSRRVYSISKSEALTITESETLTSFHLAAEALTIVEAIIPNFEFNRSIVENIAIAESERFFDTNIREALTITENVQLVRAIFVTESITISESAIPTYPDSLDEILTFIETTTLSRYKLVAESLLIAEAIAIRTTLQRTISESLNIVDGAFAYISGQSQSAAVCAEEYPVTLGANNVVTLTYPYAAPSSTLMMRNPKFGNTNTLKTNVKNIRTRTGQLIVVRPSTWPDIETFKVSFEALSKQKATDFLAFCTLSAAKEIGYLDHENRQWRGVILAETVEVSPVGIDCQFTTSFEFRGRLA